MIMAEVTVVLKGFPLDVSVSAIRVVSLIAPEFANLLGDYENFHLMQANLAIDARLL